MDENKKYMEEKKKAIYYFITGICDDEKIKNTCKNFLDSEYGKELFDFLIKNILKYLDELNNVDLLTPEIIQNNDKLIKYLDDFFITTDIFDFFFYDIVNKIELTYLIDVEKLPLERFLLYFVEIIKNK